MKSDPSVLLAHALRAPDPGTALLALAIQLRDGGVSQRALYEMFTRTFVATDPDSPLYDALQETLDCIHGGPWAKGRDLFPGTEFNPGSRRDV